MLIGVIASDGQAIGSPETGRFIHVYAEEKGVWQKKKSVSFRLDFTAPSAVRDSMRGAIAELDGCKVIVGKNIGGLPYNVLDRMGFAVFEADVFSPELLDGVRRDVESAARSVKVRETPPLAPVACGLPGHYYLDLIKLQAVRPDISSKAALRPFLRQPFAELTLVCSHLPPWLQTEPGIRCRSSKNSNGQTTVSISKDCRLNCDN